MTNADVKTYYFEKKNTISETIKLDYFDVDFISSLVKDARRRNKKESKKRMGFFDTVSVHKNGLSCHYVCSIDKEPQKYLNAIQIWNNAQDGYRKMVISKGPKNSLEMYVIWSDAYVDSLGSFWDIFYKL